jgi:hypothetical protein
MTAPAHIAETTDPDGRSVVLDREGWEHVLTGHPELARSARAIMATVSEPDHRLEDPLFAGRERFYRRGLGPARWLVAVVDYAVRPARVVTAFASRDDPPGWRWSS